MNLYLWLPLIPAVLLVGYLLQSYGRYRFQNKGEALVRDAIITNLPSDSWHLLNNITLKLDKGTTQVDHILVSRFGVFVIETKHYSGWIFGDANSKDWTQVIYKKKFRFQNPLRQNFKHLKAVQELLDFIPPEHIFPMVVFTGDATFKTDHPRGVHTLGSLLLYFKGLNEELLTENRMQFCVGRLECKRLALTRMTDVEHQEHLAAKHQ
jgi:restriction system protein